MSARGKAFQRRVVAKAGAEADSGEQAAAAAATNSQPPASSASVSTARRRRDPDASGAKLSLSELANLTPSGAPDAETLDALERGPIGPLVCFVSGCCTGMLLVWCLTWGIMCVVFDSDRIARAVTQQLPAFGALTAGPLLGTVLVDRAVDWAARRMSAGGQRALMAGRVAGAFASFLLLSALFQKQLTEGK